MPTGYTHPILEEKDHTFNEFLWHCCEQFFERDGVTMLQMTEDSVKFYEKKLAEAITAISEAYVMPIWRAEYEANQSLGRRQKENEKAAADAAENNLRLKAMRKAVESWKPPSAKHDGLKKFLLEQLDETIKFDGQAYFKETEPQTPDQWKNDKIGKAERDVEYYTQELEKSKVRAADWKQWYEDLNASVPLPPKESKWRPKWAE